MASEYRPPLSPPPQKQKSRAVPWIIGGSAVLLLGVIVVGVGGYAFYRWRNARAANENTSSALPSSGRTAGAQPAGEGINPVGSSSANANQSPSESSSTRTAWEATAIGLSGEVGKTFTLTCPARGSEHYVWGSDIYTADSSICTAAVHAGLITYERGGTVTIELRPGQPVYGSSERNGVTTGAFGEFGRSFVFKSATSESGQKEAEDVIPIIWNTPASIITYEAGKTYKFKCPAGGKENYVWGSDVYTADSSICTAAVHAGLITFERGGTVTIELRPGQSSYQGTSRNGVKSNQYGPYPRSFVVR